MSAESGYVSTPGGLYPAGTVPDESSSAIQQAKDMLFVDTALGPFLTALGQNYGIPRPRLAPADDETYRLIIQAIAFLPKTILSTLYYLMQAVFGSQAVYTTFGQRPWRIYEVNPNEFIIEIPYELLGTSNENASYLHGFAGLVLAGATSTVISCQGDARAAAVDVVGLGLSIWSGTAYEEHSITAVTYDPSTNLSQLTVVSAFSFTPAPNAPFFITVPGDTLSSFRGDYLAPIWYLRGTLTSSDLDLATDSGLAMTTNQYAGFYLRLRDGRIHYPILGNTTTTFTLAANASKPSLGYYAVVASPVDGDEEADGIATPPHADRVYITGDGRLEIVKYYMLEITRASGVVLRIEKV